MDIYAKYKKFTITQLKKKADARFSIWVRNRGSDMGENICVTCYRRLPIEELQAGHYESRRHNATRYDEDNVWPQCAGCNIFKHGNIPAYALFLIRKFGKEKLDELHKKSQQSKQFTKRELIEIIEKYS